jgi:hypothetical protein
MKIENIENEMGIRVEYMILKTYNKNKLSG